MLAAVKVLLGMGDFVGKLKYALAMVAAGGAAGAVSSANAATTVSFNIAPDATLTPVTLPGVGSPYSYGDLNTKDAFSDEQYGLRTLAGAYYGADASSPTMPTSGETWHSGDFVTATKVNSAPVAINSAENYLHLKFIEGGQEYLGYADIAGASDPSYSEATLKSVTFAAVPEPESWALLLSGLGLMGAAMRRQRRLQAALAR